MSTINDQIDAAVLEYLRAGAQNGTSSMNFGEAIRLSGARLPFSPSVQPKEWWCAELANRSCQRLRKKELIRYGRKQGWKLA